MPNSPKSWYSELIKLSENKTNYFHINASNLRSVQSLLTEPQSQIHQIFNQEKGALHHAKKFVTNSKDLALYFSGGCYYEYYKPMNGYK